MSMAAAAAAAEDSPVHSSSSSDDFAAFLDNELDQANNSSDDAEPAEDVVDDFNGKDNGNGNDNDDDDFSDDEEDDEEDNERIKRLKTEVAAVEQSEGSSSNAIAICSHPGFIRGLCILCGEKTDNEAGVAFGYIHKDLRLSDNEISRLRNSDIKTLLRHKKLCLVLDLDHTLLNSTRLEDLTAEEGYLNSQIDSLKDVSAGSLFRLDMIRMMTKLRPFVRTFLQEASSLFEMSIFTMGERAYALEMAKLLDPTGSYFHSRIISQSDCTQRHQKGLDVVLGLESAALILDDTEAVWQKNKDNLILMERYHFFSSSCRQFRFNCRSLSELKSDENESDGMLATVLGVLKKIHSKFFDPVSGDDYGARDVRQVLKTIRKEVLKDCKIVFSKVFPTNFQAASHQLWRMAEQMGATCSTEFDSDVTHVVSFDAKTEKSHRAIKKGKFLVHPSWIEASFYFWKRQPEDKYPVSPPDSHESRD